MSCSVVNTSPLIFLAKLDRLDLIRRTADEILVPPIVFEELRAKTDDSISKIEAAAQSWLGVGRIEERKLLEVLNLELDAGEAAAIALAYERSADRLIIDDHAGRRFARRLGLPLIGTLGLLLAACLRGEIRSLKTEIDRLRAAGFYASDELVAKILSAAEG